MFLLDGGELCSLAGFGVGLIDKSVTTFGQGLGLAIGEDGVIRDGPGVAFRRVVF
jgi:hypothetical protein